MGLKWTGSEQNGPEVECGGSTNARPNIYLFLQEEERPAFTPLQREPPQPPFVNQPQVFTQGPQRFPPEASVSSSFGITSGLGSQSTSDFRQSFRPDPPVATSDEQPPLPVQSFDEEPESFRTSGGASQSAIDNTFVNFPGRVPLRSPSFPTPKPSIPGK